MSRPTTRIDSGERVGSLSVGIIGAGVSGLATARALLAAGFDVVLFEKTPDVGGVWSSTRSYPGISTQDDRSSYAFSDLPMSAGVAAHPSGASVQSYLQQFADLHAISGRIRLATTVTSVRLIEDTAWEVTAEGPNGQSRERFDWLVIANGVFSRPHLPRWPGLKRFIDAGGSVLTPAAVRTTDPLARRKVAVIGWGKTACDLAVVASDVADETHIVARTITWKYPKQISALGLRFQHLVLTRAGERIFGVPYRGRDGKVLLRRLPERLPRLLLDRLLSKAVAQQLGLRKLGLLPVLEARASTSLMSDGMHQALLDGRIEVHRDRAVLELDSDTEGPCIRLTDGSVVRCDVIVAATGYERDLSFLSDDVRRRICDADEALLLHRTVLAAGVERLAFVGWTQNYRSPLTSEISALWLSGLLRGKVRPPGAGWRRRAARIPVVRTETASSGSDLPTLQLVDLDRLLNEAGVRLSLRIRLRQIWSPVDPADYAGLLHRSLHPRAALRERAELRRSIVLHR